MNKPSLASLASHYPEDRYNAYKTAHHALEKNEDDKKAFQVWSRESEILEGSVLAFMRDMAERGQLDVVPFSKGRQLPWADAWNRMVQQEDPGPFDESRLKEPLDMTCSLAMRYSKSYEEFIEEIKSCRVNVSAKECNLTGEPIFTRMQNWAPALFKYEKIDGGSQFVPITEDPPAVGVQHIEIPMPSGELLLANWFGIDAFHEVVEANKWDRPSISTEFGQHQLSADYAKKFGFMSIECGNTSPEIFKQNDKIIVGHGSNEPEADRSKPEGKVVGQITTDLWWVSAIDRQTLTSIVSLKEGPEKAESQVAAFIEDPSNGVIRLTLPPGEPLHAYFKSDRSLGKNHDTDGAHLDGFETVFVVLSHEEMDWAAVKTNKPSVRP